MKIHLKVHKMQFLNKSFHMLRTSSGLDGSWCCGVSGSVCSSVHTYCIAEVRFRRVFPHVPVVEALLKWHSLNILAHMNLFTELTAAASLPCVFVCVRLPTCFTDKVSHTWVYDHVLMKMVRQIKPLPGAWMRTDFGPALPVHQVHVILSNVHHKHHITRSRHCGLYL